MTLGWSDEEASEMHLRYYKQYGLALRGLVRHHSISEVERVLGVVLCRCHIIYRRSLDPLDFDLKCDGSLPLEDMIKPDPKLRTLLENIDRGKARVWALTNAYRTVSVRALQITARFSKYRSARPKSLADIAGG